MEKKAQAHGALAVMARFLPCLKEPPSIVEYVEQARFEGSDHQLRQWPKYETGFEYGHPVSSFCNALLVATLGAGMFTLGSAIGCNINKTCNSNFLVKSSAATAAIGLIFTVVVGAAAYDISPETLLSLARRRKRGEQEAKRNFDVIRIDNGVVNGFTLLPAMQRFYAARKTIENSKDSAALAFVETGDNIVNGIVSQFEKDQSGILQAANDILKYHNALPTDEEKTKGLPALAAKFADPKFIRALALGIFNGDDHQDLVEALKQYGDEDKLHKALVDLCTHATIVVDVINKLQERIPDALPKNIKECRERLEIRRNNLIKSYPEIAAGYGLELNFDGIVYQFEKDRSGILEKARENLIYRNVNGLTAKFANPKFIRALALGIFNGDDHQDLVEALKQYGDEDKLHKALVDLCTHAPKIDAVNAAFAALNLSGVVHLPSKANDDNREAQLEARFAALDAGAAVVQAALNPAQEPALKLKLQELEQEVREGRGLR